MSRAGKKIVVRRPKASEPTPWTPQNELVMAATAFDLAGQEVERCRQLFRLEASGHNAARYIRAWQMLISCRKTLEECIVPPSDFVSFAR